MGITHTELVNLVRDATSQVFEMMLAISVEPSAAYTDTCASVSTNGVVSFIGLAGPWAGTGSISCTAPFACKLASALMMTTYENVDDEVLDAIAEVTNMIVGNVKTALDEVLGPMGLSIPTVIYGRNFTSRTIGKQEWTIVPFKAGEEVFEIQICLAPCRDVNRSRPSLTGPETFQL